MVVHLEKSYFYFLMFLAKKAFSAFIPLNRFERSTAIQLWPNKAGGVVNCTAKKATFITACNILEFYLEKGAQAITKLRKHCFKARLRAKKLLRNCFDILVQRKLIFTRKFLHLASF